MSQSTAQEKSLISPRNVNDGSSKAPRLAIYGNDWGLMELPKLPRSAGWTYEQTLDRLLEAGFDGMQGVPDRAEMIRCRGLRFCTSARVNEPKDVDEALRVAAGAGADCITLHAGWGMEDDAQADAIVHAVLEASHRHNVPAYIETHRATLAQDVWRTCQLIKRIPQIRFNGDYSHYYCGQEMPYPGFDVATAHLRPSSSGRAFSTAGFPTASPCRWTWETAGKTSTRQFPETVGRGHGPLAEDGQTRRHSSLHPGTGASFFRLFHLLHRRRRAARGTVRPLAANAGAPPAGPGSLRRRPIRPA